MMCLMGNRGGALLPEEVHARMSLCCVHLGGMLVTKSGIK